MPFPFERHGDADHQAEVGGDQAVGRGHVPRFLVAESQFALFVFRQSFVFADFLQVGGQRVERNQRLLLPYGGQKFHVLIHLDGFFILFFLAHGLKSKDSNRPLQS